MPVNAPAWLWVGAGGFAGAVARYAVSGLAHRWLGATFPYGTLAVNVLGCLVIGLVAGVVEVRILLPPAIRAFALLGFLGSFTTFSTFGYETVALWRTGQPWLAAANVASSLLLGLGAVVGGMLLGRLIAS